MHSVPRASCYPCICTVAGWSDWFAGSDSFAAISCAVSTCTKCLPAVLGWGGGGMVVVLCQQGSPFLAALLQPGSICLRHARRPCWQLCVLMACSPTGICKGAKLLGVFFPSSTEGFCRWFWLWMGHIVGWSVGGRQWGIPVEHASVVVLSARGHGCMWLLVLVGLLWLHWRIVMLACVRVFSCNF
jgi:hypothetical protein